MSPTKSRLHHGSSRKDVTCRWKHGRRPRPIQVRDPIPPRSQPRHKGWVWLAINSLETRAFGALEQIAKFVHHFINVYLVSTH